MQKAYQSAGEITRRIGGTNYRVKIHYRIDAKENEKNSFPNGKESGTMNMPQMSRPA